MTWRVISARPYSQGDRRDAALSATAVRAAAAEEEQEAGAYTRSQFSST